MSSSSTLSAFSFKSALWAALTVILVMGAAYETFELGFYTPSVVERANVTVSEGPNRVTAETRRVVIGRSSQRFWQVEVSPGQWRDCGSNCKDVLRRALSEWQ